MTKILQTGTYCSRNKGDAAMELSFAAGIQSRIPDARLTISTPFPKIDRISYAPIPVVKCNRRRLIWGSVSVARAWLWRKLSPSLQELCRFLIANKELQSTCEADLVVDLSGDMLTEDYGPHVAYSHFLPIMIARALRKPYMICAQSVGPFGLTKPLAKQLLRHADLITAREQITYDYLTEIGISKEKLILTTDLAFLLEPTDTDVVQRAFDAENVATNNRPLLGISLSSLACSYYVKRNPNAETIEFTAMFAGVLDHICAQHDYHVLFIPHVTGPRPSADDRRFSDLIKRRMKSRATVIQGDHSPQTLKGMIARCSAYIGARMHANIAALSSGVPTLAIAYSHKTAGIMQLLGQSDHVCNIESLERDELLRKFGILHSNRGSISTTLHDRMGDLKRRAFRNIELAEELLHGGRVATGPRVPDT